MVLWGNTDAVGSALKNRSILGGPSSANGATLYVNTTPNAFINNQMVGLMAVDTTEVGITNKGEHAGWVLVKYGTGSIATAVVAANGSGFANGETVKVSGGTVNAIITITSNTNGNIFSIAVTNPGMGFTNNTSTTLAFNREKHLANVTVTGGTAAFTNTDYVIVSNGTISAQATITTNATGGVTNTSFTITNVGLFPNGITNAQAVVNAFAANGAASNGTGATFAAALVNSSGGTINLTIGGRSGRVLMETLVAMGTIQGSNTSDDTVFPDS